MNTITNNSILDIKQRDAFSDDEVPSTSIKDEIMLDNKVNLEDVDSYTHNYFIIHKSEESTTCDYSLVSEKCKNKCDSDRMSFPHTSDIVTNACTAADYVAENQSVYSTKSGNNPFIHFVRPIEIEKLDQNVNAENAGEAELTKTVSNILPKKEALQKMKGKRKFKCDTCGKILKSKSHYNDHILIHTESKKFSCDICNKVFRQKRALVRHEKIHNQHKPFVCSLCSKAFIQNYQLTEHLLQHGINIYDREFTLKNYRYKSRSEENKNLVYLCKPNDEAGSIKVTPTSLKESVETEKDCFAVNTNTAGSVKKDNTCYVCSKSFKKISHLKEHLYIHTGERPNECEKCSKKFTQKSTLSRHLLTHLGEKPFTCSLCQKGFVLKSHMQKHMSTHKEEDDDIYILGNPDRPYVCKICYKTFTMSGSLKNHMVTHSIEKNHVCHVCKQRFVHKGNLITHMTFHTKDKPFKCERCDENFKYERSLKLHLRRHFPVRDNSRTYSCSICNVLFRKKLDLNRHMYLHTGQHPHECEMCGKSFSLRSTLLDHMRKHTGERPHECSVCGSSFRMRRQLNRHFLQHTGEDRHKCEECDRVFTTKRNLNQHIQKFHPDCELPD